MTAAGKRFRAALVQLRSGRAVDANIAAAEVLIRAAARGGAHYVQTPENTTLMELDPTRLFATIRAQEENAAVGHFSALARALGIWLHIGSMATRLSDAKAANRTHLFGPDGALAATYDKIHMFDVDLPHGENYRESKHYEPGARAVLADLPWGRLGLTVCYDLRFPALYRALAQAGAAILAVPSAFTRQTGEAHWRTLLRARAIETGCWVLAAAQGGVHENGRATYGHSLVVSPWGEIAAEAGVDPCVLYADIDTGRVAEARARIPSLQHDRPFALDAPAGARTVRAAS